MVVNVVIVVIAHSEVPECDLANFRFVIMTIYGHGHIWSRLEIIYSRQQKKRMILLFHFTSFKVIIFYILLS